MSDYLEFSSTAAESLQGHLRTHWLGKTIYPFEQIDSTNSQALHITEVGTPHGTVIVANQQTAGKGRLGRRWHSPPNTNLYCSIILTQKPIQSFISWIPLASGVAVAEALEDLSGLPTSVKWPNDILFGTKKLGGILCETTTKGPSGWGAIVGIGINVNCEKTHFPLDLTETATSLTIEAERQFDRRIVLTTLLAKLESYYDYVFSSDLHALQSSYYSRSSTLGRQIRAHLVNGEQVEGFALNIGSEGELFVEPSSQPGQSTTSQSSPIEIRAGDIVHLR